MLHARIPIELKENVSGILNELGITATEAIIMFFSQIELYKGLPFPVRIPSKKTVQALKDVESGNTVEFADLDSFFADLKK